MRYTLAKSATFWTVSVEGDFDAAVGEPLAQLTRELASAPEALRLDLARVTWINSAGARQWASFMIGLARSGERSVDLAACSVHFIDYLNLVVAMGHGAHVSSFYVPLNCGTCSRQKEHLQETTAVDPAAFRAGVVCEHCAVAMRPAVHWAEYVQFLAT